VCIGVVAVTMLALRPSVDIPTSIVPQPLPSRLRTTAADQGPSDQLPELGSEIMVVLQTQELTPELVAATDRITTEAASVPGVVSVHSITNVPVLTSDQLKPEATPAFGPRSSLPISTTLAERADLATAGPMGSDDLIADDGRVTRIEAVLSPDVTAAARDDAVAALTRSADGAVADSGVPAKVLVGGIALSSQSLVNDVRRELTLLVVLACLVPAAIALVGLRRRVPVGTLLAASGCALLLAAVLIQNAADPALATPPSDDPVTVANHVGDTQLHGVQPLDIEFVGERGDLRKPENLARMDALANWLHDEYQVQTSGLSSTVRGEAAAVTGIDAVPPNPVDVEALISDIQAFDGGRQLHSLVSDDFSRARLTGYWPAHGPAQLEQLTDRFDTIAAAELNGTNVHAELRGALPDTEVAVHTLVNDLAVVGAVALGLAVLAWILGLWGRYRVAAAEAAPDEEPEVPDGPPPSLFARARHLLHDVDAAPSHHPTAAGAPAPSGSEGAGPDAPPGPLPRPGAPPAEPARTGAARTGAG
jgi:hypothetical protein